MTGIVALDMKISDRPGQSPDKVLSKFSFHLAR